MGQREVSAYRASLVDIIGESAVRRLEDPPKFPNVVFLYKTGDEWHAKDIGWSAGEGTSTVITKLSTYGILATVSTLNPRYGRVILLLYDMGYKPYLAVRNREDVLAYALALLTCPNYLGQVQKDRGTPGVLV